MSPRVLPAYCLEEIPQAQGTVRGTQAEGLTLTVQRSRQQLAGSAEGLPWLGFQGSSDQYVSAWKLPNTTKRATRRDQQGDSQRSHRTGIPPARVEKQPKKKGQLHKNA